MCRRAVRNLHAVVEHDDAVGNAHDHAHVVFDEKDRHVFVLADVEQQAVEILGFARVEAGGRLVEAQHDGPCAHGAGDLQPALVAIGKVAGGIVGAVDEAGLLQPVGGEIHGFLAGVLIALGVEDAGERVSRGTHQRVVLGHHEVLEKRHAGEEADVLEGPRHPGMLGDAEVIHPFQREAGAILMDERDGPFCRLVETGDAVEDRGLAGAVGADERGDVAAPGFEGEIAHSSKTAEAHGQVLHVEQGSWIERGHVSRVPRQPGRSTRTSSPSDRRKDPVA